MEIAGIVGLIHRSGSANSGFWKIILAIHGAHANTMSINNNEVAKQSVVDFFKSPISAPQSFFAAASAEKRRTALSNPKREITDATVIILKERKKRPAPSVPNILANTKVKPNVKMKPTDLRMKVIEAPSIISFR
jgi:hypothetical protein